MPKQRFMPDLIRIAADAIVFVFCKLFRASCIEERKWVATP